MKFLKLLTLILSSSLLLTSCSAKETASDSQINQKFLQDRIYMSNLDLSGLSLTKVPDFKKNMTPKMLEDVLYIDLSSNVIKNIQKDAFRAFPNLKELNLSYNQLKTLENVENIKGLRKLDAHSNSLTSINIKNLPSLQTLDLSYNQLESSQIAKIAIFKPLTELQLHRNKLTNIKGISRLQNLKTIKLEFNQITDVSELDKLKNLGFASVAENPLQEAVIQKWTKKSQETMERESKLKQQEELKSMKL